MELGKCFIFKILNQTLLLNAIAPEKREAAVELLKSGASIRAVAKAVGVNRSTVCSIKKAAGIESKRNLTRRKLKVSKGKGDDEFAAIPMTKSKRQYLRQKAAGEMHREKCSDCGQPRHNGSAARCRTCFRRTAALKRLAKQYPEGSPEYETGLMQIYATDYAKP